MGVPFLFPKRRIPDAAPARALGHSQAGPVVGFYDNSDIGLPPEVGDAEIFNSNVLFVSGYNRFLIVMNVTGPPPLATIEHSIIIVDPESASVTQLTSDFLFAGSGPHDRVVWGAGTGGFGDPFPWIAFQIQVTSNDGGIILPNVISWQLWLSRV